MSPAARGRRPQDRDAVRGIVVSGHAVYRAFGKLYVLRDGGRKFTFGGNNAKLILPDSATYTGKISNFAQTDKIDLTGIAFSAGSHFTFNATTDVLHVIHGSHTANLHFVDGYVASDFKIGNDGHGHTLVTTTSAGHFDAHEDELFDTAALVVPFLPETMLLELGLG